MDGNMVKRADKLAFMGIKGTGDTYTYHRMKGFTEISKSMNPIEYSRQYVDENYEQTDVVGYSPSYSYGFDQYKGDAVHAEIVRITENEVVGSEAVVPVIFVDLTQDGTTAGSKKAAMREFSVIGDSEGDSMEAYTYSGNLRVKSDRIVGSAVSSDGWQTITFTEEVTGG